MVQVNVSAAMRAAAPRFYQQGDIITDQINLAIIELNKMGDALNKPIDDMTPIEMWSAFLGYAADPRRRELINGIIERREEIGMAGAALMEISRNADERARFLSRKKAENDRISDLLTAEARGEIRGEIRGDIRGAARIAREIATDMKVAGMPIDSIVRFTKLTKTEIDAL